MVEEMHYHAGHYILVPMRNYGELNGYD